MILDTFILEYSFIINLFLLFFTLMYFFRNHSVHRLIISFVIYVIFHNFYAVLTYFHSNPELYIQIHGAVGNYSIKYDKTKIYLILLSWIVFFKIYLIFRLYQKDKLLCVLNLIKDKILYFLTIGYCCLGTFLFFYLKDIPDIYTIRFIIIKLILLPTFILLYLSYNYNLDKIKNGKIWYQYKNIAFTTLFISLFIIFIEFYIYNKDLNADINCVSFSDYYCLMRPSGSFMNPNNLAVYLLLSLFIIKFRSFCNFRISNIDGLCIILISLSFYITTSRSILIVSLLMFFILFNLFLFKKKIKMFLFNLKLFILFTIPFLLGSFLFIYKDINYSIININKLLFYRWYDLVINLWYIFYYFVSKVLIIVLNFVGLNASLDSNKFTKIIDGQSISGRISSSATDNTLHHILNTEGFFNFFFISLLIFIWIYKSFFKYYNNTNYASAFNITFGLIIFFQSFFANFFALFPIYFLVLIIYFYINNETINQSFKGQIA